MQNDRGFTLIELLIVVAIIAILAAIAVPNFLEAQTRAKVSRVKSDMRTQVTALESYRVDNNTYPVPAAASGVQAAQNVTKSEEDGTLPYGDYFELKMSARITTPIAYLSSRPWDVFLDFESDHDYAVANNSKILYHYGLRRYAEEWNSFGPTDPSNFNNYAKTMLANPTSAEFYLLSHGPDNFHNGPDEDVLLPCPYDPTNGSTSGGDITYWGPGQGFK